MAIFNSRRKSTLDRCSCGNWKYKSCEKCQNCSYKLVGDKISKAKKGVIRKPKYYNRYCIQCGTLLATGNNQRKSNYCRKCTQEALGSYPWQSPVCLNCGKVISKWKYKYCGKCKPLMYGISKPDQEDGYRSGWELAFSRWLGKNHIRFEYEPERFKTPYGTYIPDFYLPNLGLWVEVKGRFYQSSEYKQKMKMKYFSESHKLLIVKRDELKEAEVI